MLAMRIRSMISGIRQRTMRAIPLRDGRARPQTGGVGGMALSPVSPVATLEGVGGMALSPAPSIRLSRATVTVRSSALFAVPPDRLFAFHADVRNLPRLTPGPARIVQASAPTRANDLQVIEIGAGPLRRRWDARIARFDPPRTVVDVQERGPFQVWRHTHAVRPRGNRTLLVDTVEFRLLPGAAGRVIDALLVAPLLRLLFAERHRRTRRILDAERVR